MMMLVYLELIVYFLIQVSSCDKKVKPLLLVSFDGMQNEKLSNYIQLNPNSNFKKFIENGVRADYMTPSFPSSTFPNHWTIMTGIYKMK
jgi:predicted AlkP superfamily pyrophosphatase or phosphodiesterase